MCALVWVGLTSCASSDETDAQGPWLIVGTALDGRTMDGLLLVSEDGSEVTRLLEDQLIFGPNEFGASLSPDGRHLAYITASDTSWHHLTLNVISIPDGTTEEIAPLLSPETRPDEDARTLADPSYAAANAIVGQDRSLAWSPDGMSLAFIGAQSGNSADLYLYSMQDGSITHLTAEPEHAMRPLWSPGGRSVLIQTYRSFEIAGGFDMGSVWLVDVETGAERMLYDPGPVEDELVVGWFSDAEFLVFSRDIDCGWHNLRFYDVEEKTTLPVWPMYFNKMSYHGDSQTFLLSIDSYTAACNDTSQSGLFLLPLDSTEPRPVSDIAPVELAVAPDTFYAVTLEPSVFTIDLTGQIDRLPDPIAFVPVASPDGEYWAWAGQHPKFEAGLWVGPAAAEPELIYEGAVQVATWLPSGGGLFFVGDNALYLWHLQEESPELIQSEVVLRDLRGAIWAVPPE